jgi:2-polyprenyl-3-methyl-5-hydroxy-6-metoxy-1,4-benzoquinol methylase
MTPDDFDAKAKTWDADLEKHERARRVADAIRAAVPDLAQRSVLEIGAGTGLLGLSLQPHAAHVTLTDTSREMLAVAAEKVRAAGLANVTTTLLDLTSGPPPEARWDLACSLMTLHHIPDTAGLLRTLHALLAPGGVVALADLDAEDGSFHGAGVDVHHGFDRAVLAAQLERAGFREVRLSTAFEVRKATERGERAYPAFLAIARRG